MFENTGRIYKNEALWLLERHCPDAYSHTIDAYMFGTDELMCKTDDGHYILFNCNDHTRLYGNTYADILRQLYPVNEDRWRENFIYKLNYIVNKYGATQETLSRDTGISQPTISNYLSGKYDIRMSSLMRIIWALNPSIEEVCDLIGYMQVDENGEKIDFHQRRVFE